MAMVTCTGISYIDAKPPEPEQIGLSIPERLRVNAFADRGRAKTVSIQSKVVEFPKKFESSAAYLVWLRMDVLQRLDILLDKSGIKTPENRREITDLVLRKVAEEAAPVSEQSQKPLYKDRNHDPNKPELAGTNVVEWLRLVWGEEMKERRLTRVELRRADPSADVAVDNWLRKSSLPSDIYLPTRKEVNDATLAQMPLAEIRSAQRIAQAVRRRKGIPTP